MLHPTTPRRSSPLAAISTPSPRPAEPPAHRTRARLAAQAAQQAEPTTLPPRPLRHHPYGRADVRDAWRHVPPCYGPAFAAPPEAINIALQLASPYAMPVDPAAETRILHLFARLAPRRAVELSQLAPRLMAATSTRAQQYNVLDSLNQAAEGEMRNVVRAVEVACLGTDGPQERLEALWALLGETDPDERLNLAWLARQAYAANSTCRPNLGNVIYALREAREAGNAPYRPQSCMALVHDVREILRLVPDPKGRLRHALIRFCAGVLPRHRQALMARMRFIDAPQLPQPHRLIILSAMLTLDPKFHASFYRRALPACVADDVSQLQAQVVQLRSVSAAMWQTFAEQDRTQPSP